MILTLPTPIAIPAAQGVRLVRIIANINGS
jgi:hypothetical protein